MSQRRPITPRPRRLPAAIAALFVLIAALIVTAPTAAAVTVCDNVDGEIVVLVDEPDLDDRTYIGMEEGELFVNNVSCGLADTVAIVDIGTEKVDDIVIDLSSPMRSGGSLVFVSLFLDPDPDTGDKDLVTVIGRSTPDYATLTPDNLVVARATDYPGADEGDNVRLGMGFADSGPFRLDVRLKGSADTFAMVAVDGDFFSDPVVVRGGSGNDILTGGEHRQRLRGGSGRDVLTGGRGNDDLLGQSGRDILRGSSGSDTLIGGSGVDEFFGGSGNDEFFAADGNAEVLVGGPGSNDVCVECDPDDDTSNGIEG